LRLKGIRGLPMVKKPVVVVDVPEGIELIDGAGYYGKKRKTQLLGSAWDHFVDPAIGQWLGRLAPDHVNWDYESSAFTGYLVCYDDRCLDAFRKSVGLQAGVPLRSDLVKKDYHEAWLDFMAKRSSEVARRFRESIGKHRPSAMFSMYSGYQCPDTKETYNVDWALCAPHLDLVMCGYGRRIEEILATRRAAGNTPCVFGCITYPYEFNDDRAVSTITAAEALRRLCDARGGVLYYSLSNGDARTLLAFAKVSRVAAEFAEFFARGTEDRSGFAVTSGDKSDTYIFSLGKRKLLCLVNETGMPAHFEIECPGPARDFFSKGTLHRTQLRVDVPSRGIAVFTVGE